MQVPKGDPRLAAGTRVEVLHGTYYGCRGVVISTNGMLYLVQLDPIDGEPSFSGRFSAYYLSPLNILDRLAEDV